MLLRLVGAAGSRALAWPFFKLWQCGGCAGSGGTVWSSVRACGIVLQGRLGRCSKQLALQGRLTSFSPSLYSKPPKGFEKFFKNKKNRKSASPGNSVAPNKEPKNSGPGGDGGHRGGKGDDFTWWKRMQKGEFPWDDKDFRSLAVLGAGVASGFLYFYFRDPGKEITWKHFVQYYLARGLVRRLYSVYVGRELCRKFAVP